MKKMFRTLLEMLNPPKQEARMFGLSDSEVRQLRELRGTAEWSVFLKVLDMQSTMEGEGMLASMDATATWLHKGRILGLRKAGFLIDEILQKESEKQVNDERRRYNSQHANDHISASLYGTAAW